MKKSIILLMFALTPVAFGQGVSTPPDADAAIAATVNFTGKISQGITDLITSVAPSMMPIGWAILAIFGVYALLQTLLQTSLRSVATHHFTPLAMVTAYVAILFRIVIAALMLGFYMNVIPGLGVNFHQIFPAMGNALSKAVTADLLKAVILAANDAMNKMPAPGILDIFPALVALCVLFNIALMQVGTTIITAGSYAIVGILTLCGPLMIPFYVLPGNDKRFWSWIDNMIAYSMYTFVGSAFVFIFMHVYIDFFTNLHGLSVGQWFVSLPYLILINCSFLWAMFKVPEIAHIIFGGIGGVAQGFANNLQALAVSGIAAALL